MNCIICNDVCDKYDGKVWITLKNENYYDTYSQVIHYCSYLCHQRNKHHLPKDHWKNVMNKEDFNCPLPVIPSKDKRFEYITYNEYIELNDLEKEKYDLNKEKNEEINLNYSSFHQEQYEEDKRTSMIEDHESISDDSIDDY